MTTDEAAEPPLSRIPNDAQNKTVTFPRSWKARPGGGHASGSRRDGAVKTTRSRSALPGRADAGPRGASRKDEAAARADLLTAPPVWATEQRAYDDWQTDAMSSRSRLSRPRIRCCRQNTAPMSA